LERRIYITVDGTIFMVKDDFKNIFFIKVILRCFELAPRVKDQFYELFFKSFKL